MTPLPGRTLGRLTQMTAYTVTPELGRWILQQLQAGHSPRALLEILLQPMLDSGWEKQAASDAIEQAMRVYIEDGSRVSGPPGPASVPAAVGLNGPAIVESAGRPVQVLASMLNPRIIVFGSLLSDDECDQLVALARDRITRSATFNLETGLDEVHEARTSEGTFFHRGAHALCDRIESRIAALLDWPVDHGEGLQVLRYGPGAEYKPHYDYFDPDKPGTANNLARGGQRVASLVMYLNTPKHGGATTFPDVDFEVAPIKGNAVFFSYDRPHPMTRTLHGGAPVIEGEKWVATKWLRQHRHE